MHQFHRRVRVITAALVAAAMLLFGAARVVAADAAVGRQKAQACAVCHGPLGISVAPDAPNLAGQPEIYLAEQLKAYRSGRRRHPTMDVVAKGLQDAEIDDLAAWYASIAVRAEPRGK
jgi:cytochrome c553